MQRPTADSLVHGALGGLLAGALVAIWFFALDVIAGEPLRTPLSLAAALLGEEIPAAGLRLIAGYTLLHFTVFALLGAGASWLVALLRLPPGLLAGAFVGLVVLNSVHYGAFLISGARVLSVLPPLHAVLANLCGGIALMLYVHRATRSEAMIGIGLLRHHRLLARGTGTGMIGAATVAVWFFLLDILTSTPFHTPAALGSAVFLGATSAADVQFTAGVVGAYTVLHVVAFSAVGVVLVRAADWLESAPGMWLIALMAFLILEGLFFAAATVTAGWILGALSLWAVGIGNLLAVAAMGGWIWARSPELQHRFRGVPVETHL